MPASKSEQVLNALTALLRAVPDASVAPAHEARDHVRPGAIEHFARAMRLSPLDPEMYRMQAGIALAHLFAGRFDTASSWAEKASRDLPSFLIPASIIAASHALAGRMDDARRAMDHLRQLDSTLRIPSLRDWLPIHRPEDLATFADRLRKAGLPE